MMLNFQQKIRAFDPGRANDERAVVVMALVWLALCATAVARGKENFPCRRNGLISRDL
jgi:hypothetical protein